jgi:uncharacterized protein (TIRG00374 family)
MADTDPQQQLAPEEIPEQPADAEEHADGRHHDEQMPSVHITRRRLVMVGLFVAIIVAFLYFGLPKLVGFGASFKRLEHGDARWLIAAAILEALSFCSDMALFRAVCVEKAPRITFGVSYQITMAGLIATRVLSAGGAGGVAITAWAMRRAGMPARLVATRLVAYMALLYGVYMLALLVDGVGLYLHIFPGEAPFALTIIPAIIGATAITLFLLISLLPKDFSRIVQKRAQGHGLQGKLSRRIATVPESAASGIRTAIMLVRQRKIGLLGAITYWGFDIATLWACFHAFGYAPQPAVIVMAYFVGWLANLLPIPGGLGGVEGGLIGSFTAFGVNVQAAVVAVLAYRAFSFWLPMIPGVASYFQLRHTVIRWREDDEATAAARSGQLRNDAV